MSDLLTAYAPAKKPDQMNPLALAYMGDAVYDLYIRQLVLSRPNHRPNHLHREAVKYVSAKAQSQALQTLLPELTAEELEVVKRGRNAKSGSSPKNTDILEYRHSTAFECLLGYLFYHGQYERLQQLLAQSVEKREERKPKEQET